MHMKNLTTLRAILACGSMLMAMTTVEANAQTGTRYFARQHLNGIQKANPTQPIETDPTGDFSWRTGEYGQWSSTCNAQSERMRAVSCVDAQGAVVGDAQCLGTGVKPTSKDTMLIVSDCSGEFKNGDFENGLANWNVSGDARADKTRVFRGTTSLMLFSQGDPGGAQQTFATIPGVTYTLSFYAWKAGYQSTYQYYRLVDSTAGIVKDAKLTGAESVYTQYAVTWKAVGKSATAIFEVGVRGGAYELRLDDVKLSATQ